MKILYCETCGWIQSYLDETDILNCPNCNAESKPDKKDIIIILNAHSEECVVISYDNHGKFLEKQRMLFTGVRQTDDLRTKGDKYSKKMQ
ncbi:MAG: hypothetical protein ACFFAS_20345 [Promethearchaeota archaeon]